MQNRASSDRSHRLFAALLVAALCPFVASLVFSPGQSEHPAIEARLAAQGGTTIWDGVYTAAQAKRGRTAYLRECAECHNEDLMGDGVAPALAGDQFFSRWRDLTVSDLWVATRNSMPQSNPGSLSPAGYSDITAFTLQMNKAPAGDTELASNEDDLKAIVITKLE